MDRGDAGLGGVPHENDEARPEVEQIVSEPQTSQPRPTLGTLLARGLRLRCPKCGQGALYRKLTRMYARCPHCNFVYDRAPGYYLGALYINYGVTALTLTAFFLIARIGLNLPTRQIIWPAGIYCVIFPMLMYRHSRALWLAMDCYFDESVLSNEGADR